MSDERPTARLPTRELARISLYWLGLSSIFAGLTIILAGRLEFDGLLPDPDSAGLSIIRLTAAGAIIAIVVQPTVGAISDHTTSRWGRRKPYIVVGTILDVVFLVGIASGNDLLSIGAFIALLQFSSNVAQGPFQGYVPDLVPEPQVGLASALVGMMQVFGNITGFVIASIAVATEAYGLGLIALGLIELVTMLAVVVGVRDVRPAKPRAGRSWLAVAASAWSLDILRERSFIYLLGSRLTILAAGGILTSLGVFYLSRSFGYPRELTGTAIIPVVGLIAIGTIVAVVPAARLSDRFGRKPVIYLSCLVGAIGLALVASAPILGQAPAALAAGGDGAVDTVAVITSDPRYAIALAGAVAYGLSAGAFLAVDWALITDIIPKASSGRYMGISNVATASSGILALIMGGSLMDISGRVLGTPAGPMAAMWLAVTSLGVGALLLRPVVEPRRRPRQAA